MDELVSGNGSASGFLSPAALGGMCQYVTLSVPLGTMMSCLSLEMLPGTS